MPDDGRAGPEAPQALAGHVGDAGDAGDVVDVFEVAVCGLASLDADGTVARANPEFLRLVGRAADDVVGVLELDDLLSAAGRVLAQTHLGPILEHSGEVREIALEVLRPDGSRVPVILGARTDVRTGRVVLAVLETRDRDRYERDLLEATRTAEVARRHADALAYTLQQTLIPPRPPSIPHLAIEAAYRPAGDGREVGGDFYDVFQVGEQQWIVVLGDVSGKGVAAAVVTSFVRYTVRTLAFGEPDPARLLARLDEAMRDHETERYCTLALARLDRVDGTWQVAVSLAGHPPPLLRSPDGTVRELGVLGTPVGLVPRAEFTTVHHVLRDETITLYTDGVTEARSDEGMLGEERLVAVVAAARHDVASITADIEAAALAWQHQDLSDDLAVITFGAT